MKVFPQAVHDAVLSHPEYAARRAEAERTLDDFNGAMAVVSLTGDVDALTAAQAKFHAAQARVTELYDAAYAAHREAR